MREAALARYHENREERLVAMREYHAANREKRAAAYRRWCSENPRVRDPAKESQYRHARRARLAGARVERVDVAVVFERDEGVCGICGDPVDPASWHLDHIVPLARGGEHSYANVQVAHPVCNLRKGARPPGDAPKRGIIPA